MGNFVPESKLGSSRPVPSAPPLQEKGKNNITNQTARENYQNSESCGTGNDVIWDTATYEDFQADLPRPKGRTFSASSAASVVSEKRRKIGCGNSKDC